MISLKMGRRELKLQIMVLLSLLLHISFAQFKPADNYLIDCGASSSTTIHRRTFVADTSNTLTVSYPNSVTRSTTPASVSSIESSTLYQTARIFPETSSYTFKLKSRARHFVRLYFFPFPDQTYTLADAKFSVATQVFTLLSNFKPKRSSAEMKEYLMNVTSDNLVLTFTPSERSIAFVNAIEVVSVPDNLIPEDARTVNPVGPYKGVIHSTAFETVFRINMGGPRVWSSNDTLWRNWVPDRDSLVNGKVAETASFSGEIVYPKGGATRETAPDPVYSTATQMAFANVTNANFNVSWELFVDSTYTYFVRLHFCDIVSKSLHQLVFNVYIAGFAALSDFDLGAATSNTLAAAYYADFVLDGADAHADKLRISISPMISSRIDNPNAILNGLEIFKMNNSAGSLSGQSLSSGTPSGPPSKKMGVIIGAVIGSVFIAAAAVILFLVYRKKKATAEQQSGTYNNPFSFTSWVSSTFGTKKSTGSATGHTVNLGYRFPFAVLQKATDDFDEKCVIGRGGFGKVYKGVLEDGTKIAAKRGGQESSQGLNEFINEIELLSQLRHRHLVSLIGYCDENGEMILVYEFMEMGTLKTHLYKSNKPTLSWKERIKICIESARGLHYLHTGQAKAIIHRDIKSENILLDDTLTAKVADFGLSKTGPEVNQTHVSTAVKGSFGYLDPEYFRRQQLTEKSDVYSFGVVLLEVLCARPALDLTLPKDEINLAEWAIKWQKKGRLDEIVDQKIAGTLRPESLREFGKTVEKCLADHGVDRPTMGDVLWSLEYVLKLEEGNNYSLDPDGDSIITLREPPSHALAMHSITQVQNGQGDQNFSDATSIDKSFSQMLPSQGR